MFCTKDNNFVTGMCLDFSRDHLPTTGLQRSNTYLLKNLFILHQLMKPKMMAKV